MKPLIELAQWVIYTERRKINTPKYIRILGNPAYCDLVAGESIHIEHIDYIIERLKQIKKQIEDEGKGDVK